MISAWPLQLLTLSATTESELSKIVERCVEYFQETAFPLVDLAYTFNSFPPPMNTHYRLAVLGSTAKDISDKLKSGKFFKAKVVCRHGTPIRPKTCFLFPGFGNCAYKMGQELYNHVPLFKSSMDAAEIAVRKEIPSISILNALYGSDRSLMNHPIHSLIPQLYLEYSLFKVWSSWLATKPDFVSGHSMGEYVAACGVGVHGIQELIQISAWFTRNLDQIQDGTMAVVVQEEGMIKTLMDEVNEEGGNDWVEISSKNTGSQFVLGGTGDGMKDLMARCKALKITGVDLPLKKTFHTRGVEKVIDSLTETVKGFAYRVPKSGFISSSTGKVEDFITPAYWKEHFRRPVDFRAASQTMLKEGVKVFVEVGGNTPLGTMVQENAGGTKSPEYQWLASLRSGKGELETMLGTLAQLYVLGIDPDWTSFYAGEKKLEHRDTTWMHDPNQKGIITKYAKPASKGQA